MEEINHTTSSENKVEYTNKTTGLPIEPSTKFYTSGWVGFATYVGGPIAGGYLMSQNFKRMGDSDAAKKSFWYGVLAELLIFPALLLLPESIVAAIPNYLIPIIYTSVVAGLMAKHQDPLIKNHLEKGGAKQSGWRAFGVAVLAAIISFLYIMVLFFATVFLMPTDLPIDPAIQ